MLTKEDILKRLREHKGELQQKFPVKDIALFGSYARGEQTPESDIDFLVEFSEPVGWEMVDLMEELEKIFAGSKVDLISKGGIKPRMWPYIEEDLIYA
jgi:predicted nucleotidyltransferase